MKIKNDYIKIKTNSKETTLHNYIYDNYLRNFTLSQYVLGLQDNSYNENINLNDKKMIKRLYIKFTTPLEDYTNASVSDFDIYMIIYDSINKTTTNNSVSVFYIYNLDNVSSLSESLEEYYGEKITALGFGDYEDIMACVDTSLYDIYLLEGEHMQIMRKDIISTDGECVGYDYPVHLSPLENYEKTRFANNTGYLARLYSIGFGTQKGVINSQEKIFAEKVDGTLDVKYINDKEFSVNIIKQTERSQYPSITKYAGSIKYPLALNVLREIFPSTISKIPSNSKYPLAGNYKFIVIKYRLFYYDYSMGGIEKMETNKFYTINIPLTTEGLFEFKFKMTRKDI